jgi:hypothetical protein
LLTAAAIGWQEEEHTKEALAAHLEAPHNRHIIEYGNHAKAIAIEYANWLVTTINTSIPDETQPTPTPHPCTQ